MKVRTVKRSPLWTVKRYPRPWFFDSRVGHFALVARLCSAASLAFTHSAVMAIRTCSCLFGRRCRLSSNLANNTCHPASVAEHAFNQRRQIQIRIELGPVQSQSRWADLNLFQIGRLGAGEALRKLDRQTEFEPIAQAHYDAVTRLIEMRRRGVRLGVQARLQRRFGLLYIFIGQIHGASPIRHIALARLR